MLGVYNYTVILTYIGMLTGFIGITYAMDGNIHGALVCLMVAGVCDMFDGKIASTKQDRTKQELRFGVQIDSLSDLICFGALPAVIVYATSGGKLHLIIPGIYLLCALIRLARFNVDEEGRQEEDGERRVLYSGLPVTFAAVIFPVTVALCSSFGWKLSRFGPILMALTALAFVSPFQLRRPHLHSKVAFVALAIVLLALIAFVEAHI